LLGDVLVLLRELGDDGGKIKLHKEQEQRRQQK